MTYSKWDGNEPQVAKLKMIWSLEPGAESQKGRRRAGTLPGALFKSDDFGATWKLAENLWNVPERKFWVGGGADQPGIHFICIDPRDANVIRIAVSCGGVWEKWIQPR